MDKSNSGNEFKRTLNLFDSTALVIGSMIGSGIFIVSAEMSRTLGAPGWLLVAWVITGIITLLAALSYGELAGMMPKAGGQYVYLREAYNPMIGFLYGWTLFTVIQTGTIAAVAVAFAKFTGVLFPFFSPDNIWLNLGFIKFNTAQILAIISIIILTWINLNGIKTGRSIQNVFTFIKVFALLALIVLGIFFAQSGTARLTNMKIFWDATTISGGQITTLTGFSIVIAIAVAMVGSVFSSDAWNNITFTAGEVINPKKNIPLSLFIGTLIVTIIYILANVAFLNVIPLRGIESGTDVISRGIQFATNGRVGTATMEAIIGGSGAIVMAIFIMISTFGCNNGLIIAGARVYYAMSLDGLFFRKTGELNKQGVPASALKAQAIWASLLCLSGTYSDLLDYIVFAVLLFYVLTIFGIFILRRTKPDAERPYKAIGYPVLPFVYILLAVTMMIILLIYKPAYTWPGLIIVLTGIPVYYLWSRKEPIKRN